MDSTLCIVLFFFNDTATTEIYTLSLHAALPILLRRLRRASLAVLRKEVEAVDQRRLAAFLPSWQGVDRHPATGAGVDRLRRSEEHTAELQSRQYLVCRLLLEKKKKMLLCCLPIE